LKLKAKEEIEREKNEALKEIRNEVVSLALEAASKVFGSQYGYRRKQEAGKQVY